MVMMQVNDAQGPIPEGAPLQGATRGVSLLTGDPKKAILVLSGPMVIATLLYSTYNIVNAIWVAGLGSDALAAVGFITPLFMVLIGLSNGLGAGTASVISRRIGAGDHAGANNTAIHALIITCIISALITIPLVLFCGPIVIAFGAGRTAGLAIEYGQVIFAGTTLLLVTSVLSAILRAEGDTRRATYVIGASAVINMVLDPLLIYYAGMGISGAAWGLIISQVFVLLVLLYWFLGRRDTFVALSARFYSPDRKTVRDILNIGLPASFEFLLMSLLSIIVNGLLVTVAGPDEVAVYTAGWRVVLFGIIPIVAISTSVITVGGAAYGGRHFTKLPLIHGFSVSLGVAIGIAVSIITWRFAPQIATIFTYTAEGAHLAPSIAAFLGTMCFFYPFVSPGIMSSAIFQGTGRGMTSLVLSLLRNLVFIAVFAYFLGIVAGFGEHGIWWGIVAGDILGGAVAYIWARVFISRLVAYG
jgi:putative MATE family efflux protein